MKILLDENLPHKLKADFGEDFEVITVRNMGWLGKKNGELLGLLVLNGFEFFITLDKNLKYQQNLNKFKVTIFLLISLSNRRKFLQPLIEKVKERIKSGNFQKLTEISILT